LQFYLVGNGAMIEEMATVLSDLGVDRRNVYQEAYFNSRYRPDASILAEIRNRFVANDLFSPYSHLEAGLFMPEAPLTRARSRRS
jgi:ferredoxin-NADP reductase